MKTAYPLTIYYDRSCPYCEHEMRRLKECDREDNLLLIDCSAPDFVSPPGAPDVSRLMQWLHARTADGQWLVGAPAIQAAYAGAGFDMVAAWMDRPLAARTLKWLYPLIARYRYLLPTWVATAWFAWLARRAARRAQACANGKCEL